MKTTAYRPLLLLLTFVALPSASLTARASGYGVSGAGDGYSGSGTITATSQGGGEYLITSMSGTGFNGLYAPGGFNGNDNLLFPNGSQYVDGSGFSFSVTDGADTDDVNIFWNSTQAEYEAYILEDDGTVDLIPVTFNLTAESSPMAMSLRSLSQTLVEPQTQTFSFSFAPDADGGQSLPQTPEPASVVLLGTGLAGLVGAARRRVRA